MSRPWMRHNPTAPTWTCSHVARTVAACRDRRGRRHVQRIPASFRTQRSRRLPARPVKICRVVSGDSCCPPRGRLPFTAFSHGPAGRRSHNPSIGSPRIKLRGRRTGERPEGDTKLEGNAIGRHGPFDRSLGRRSFERRRHRHSGSPARNGGCKHGASATTASSTRVKMPSGSSGGGGGR